jgi:hypothetical protein
LSWAHRNAAPGDQSLIIEEDVRLRLLSASALEPPYSSALGPGELAHGGGLELLIRDERLRRSAVPLLRLLGRHRGRGSGRHDGYGLDVGRVVKGILARGGQPLSLARFVVADFAIERAVGLVVFRQIGIRTRHPVLILSSYNLEVALSGLIRNGFFFIPAQKNDEHADQQQTSNNGQDEDENETKTRPILAGRRVEDAGARRQSASRASSADVFCTVIVAGRTACCGHIRAGKALSAIEDQACAAAKTVEAAVSIAGEAFGVAGRGKEAGSVIVVAVHWNAAVGDIVHLPIGGRVAGGAVTRNIAGAAVVVDTGRAHCLVGRLVGGSHALATVALVPSSCLTREPVLDEALA